MDPPVGDGGQAGLADGAQRHDRPLALVADDNEVTRALYAMWLRAEGHDVVEASDGDKAVLAITEHQPDLVVCDVNMPGRSGPEVTRWIRQSPAAASIPVVQVSAQMDAEFLEGRRLDEGADAYLAMPVSRERFIATIRSLATVDRRSTPPTGSPRREPVDDAPRVRGRFRLGLKIAVLLAPLVIGITGVGFAGWSGMGSMAALNDDLYEHELRAAVLLNDLNTDFAEARALVLALISENDPLAHAALLNDLTGEVLPHIEEDLTALAVIGEADSQALPESALGVLVTQWRRFVEILDGPAFLVPGDDAAAAGATSTPALEVDRRYERVARVAGALTRRAVAEAEREHADGQRGAASARRRLAGIATLTVLLAAALALRLHRDVVRRTKHYSEFAMAVASGTASTPVIPRGRDEITELGHALNRLVDQQTEARREHERRMAFSSALQIVADEDEAHSLLQRHVERWVPDSAAFVFTRNNSADRLEVRTPLPQPSALGERVAGAMPHSCRAVRTGRVHDEQMDDKALARCELCRGVSGASICVPLLVGGEVIGSVLTCVPDLPDQRAREFIQGAVVEAAPVIANLRNMAVAEHRATVDALTGLATRRAVQEALSRLVAHALRQGEQLAALMLDLDHFKNVNDTYGHETGDRLLAAVGAAIAGSIRASDLAGRFGGEEFVVLLPGRAAKDAAETAERIRVSIARIRIPDGPPQVTASVGIAGFPDHASDIAGLLRMADRALYEAKRVGRNRVIHATSGLSIAPNELAPGE